jgi:hypothetical protein
MFSEAESIARGLGAKPNGKGWKARCPAHDDDDPSLDIDEGAGGKPLLNCRAGCSQNAVIAALERKGLWNGKGNGRDRGLVYYEYTKGSVPYLRKVKAPKGSKYPFWWQQPDGKGGWISTKRAREKKLKAVSKEDRQRLYRIDEAREQDALGRVVAVAEGEKDCDTLWALGIPAVCNPDGASNDTQKPKWKPEHSEQLRGFDIVVLNDNDAPGCAHADATCRASVGIAKSVKRLDLKALDWPDMPNKADVTDWHERGGTRERLDELIAEAKPYEASPPDDAVAAEDFYAYLPQHAYLYVPTRELWPASSVDALLGDGAAEMLDRTRPVVQMTWAPGLPMIVCDRVVDQGGWVEREGVKIFNLYRPPTLPLGDPSKAGPWVDHVRRVYPDDADHIISYLAHRAQRPHEKINHGLVLGGPPGTGKDTLLEPAKRAVGPWNCSEVSPTQVLGRFNGFVKSVILRVSETRDLGEMNRFALYEHMKALLAAPPDVIRCDEKNLREHSVFNVMGVVMTTNRKDSLYLPPDDRRHYVAWTEITKDDFEEGYWNQLWQWYERGGFSHIAAYLTTLDISAFDPKAPPPKTNAFWEITELNRSSEDSEFAAVLDALGQPDAVSLLIIGENADYDLKMWLRDRRNNRQMPHRMGACGYTPVRNPYETEGRWKIGGKHQIVYARTDLSPRARLDAATALVRSGRVARRGPLL